MKNVLIDTEDGYKLSLHIFAPKESNSKLVLINSATGVKQQIYFGFATFLAQNGFTVLTYDYRGIGLSKPAKMRGFAASMRTWGSVDYKAVTNYILDNYQTYYKFCIGHSVGALIVGMNSNSSIFNKYVFIGTQNAYVGRLNIKTKIQGYLGFGLVQPIFTKLFGYFPANWFGLGESLPADCANDWRKLVLNKKSTNKLLENIPNYSADLDQDVLVLRAEDDFWLTDKAVKSLFDTTYINMKPNYRLIYKAESPKLEVGHINFFRTFNQNLWSIILNYLK